MSFVPADMLCCPLDQLPLRANERTLVCATGHSFDLAKQGYVNLLSAADKRSRDPGDSRQMVGARRDFLDAGHYQRVAEKVAAMVIPQVRDGATVVDAGCGEGYYLEQLLAQLCAAGKAPANVIGFDISKWAVRSAARKLPATWMVASNRNIPVADHSVDLLLSLFGFPAYESFRRVLKPGGALLLVNAGPRHLIELREVIYPLVETSESNELQRAQAAGFSLVDSALLAFETGPLSMLEIGQLLSMTPHLFRASREGKERAEQLDNFAMTVEVSFHLLQ